MKHVFGILTGHDVVCLSQKQNSTKVFLFFVNGSWCQKVVTSFFQTTTKRVKKVCCRVCLCVVLIPDEASFQREDPHTACCTSSYSRYCGVLVPHRKQINVMEVLVLVEKVKRCCQSVMMLDDDGSYGSHTLSIMLETEVWISICGTWYEGLLFCLLVLWYQVRLLYITGYYQ
jgi:hypothetical protein